jgi:hypothetical protein
MACERVTINGFSGIVCGIRRAKPKRCKGCGRPATLECDWKVPTRSSGTCDAPLCARCTTVPAPDKDLCPKHAAEWAERSRQRRLPIDPPPAESGPAVPDSPTTTEAR